MNRKTEDGASSEPAFDVSQVCLRVRGLFGLTGELFAAAQIELGQGGARLEHNDVTCGAMTAMGVFVCETCRLGCLMVRLLVQSGWYEFRACFRCESGVPEGERSLWPYR